MKASVHFVCILFLAVTISCKPKPMPSSLAQLQVALQQAGGKDKVEEEAAELLARFGGENLASLDRSELTNCPALNQLASTMRGEILGIWPGGPDGIGLPAHIRIRFGTHTDYRFVLIVGKESVVSPTQLAGLKPVGSTIYLKE